MSIPGTTASLEQLVPPKRVADHTVLHEDILPQQDHSHTMYGVYLQEPARTWSTTRSVLVLKFLFVLLD